MADETPDFFALLRTLMVHRVDFIVVGGVCAVLHGAPVTTFDLDLVHVRSDANVEKLLLALDDLKAIFREQPSRRLSPAGSHLLSSGHQLLLTRYGPLDLLGTIGPGLGYEELLPHTAEFAVDDLTIRVLDLETLIAVKEHTGREKDHAILPVLRRTLDQQKKNAQ